MAFVLARAPDLSLTLYNDTKCRRAREPASTQAGHRRPGKPLADSAEEVGGMWGVRV